MIVNAENHKEYTKKPLLNLKSKYSKVYKVNTYKNYCVSIH